ncbi:MAG: hypothetical protein JWP01_4279 [Myxococcales bacterium]|nr:hypothetical protein [Myxococcales bacterium]
MSDAPRTVPTSKLPAPKEAKASNARFTRTVALCALVSLVAWGIYVQARPGARFPTLVVLIGLSVVPVILFIAQMIRLTRQAIRFIPVNAKGSAALARGDLKVARDIFWQSAEQTSCSQVSAIARHNLGWTLMRQGELQQAIDVLTDNEDRNRAALTSARMYPTSAVDLALDYGLLGDLDAAEKWMTEVERRATELSNPTLPAMKAFARAVLDCRAGRCSEAARMLHERWAEYEATLTGETLRPMRIVRAFAIAAEGPRSAGLAETAIAMARPAYPGEYDFLGVAWPEMKRFLASHQLTRARSPVQGGVDAVAHVDRDSDRARDAVVHSSKRSSDRASDRCREIVAHATRE